MPLYTWYIWSLYNHLDFRNYNKLPIHVLYLHDVRSRFIAAVHTIHWRVVLCYIIIGKMMVPLGWGPLNNHPHIQTPYITWGSNRGGSTAARGPPSQGSHQLVQHEDFCQETSRDTALNEASQKLIYIYIYISQFNYPPPHFEGIKCLQHVW